MASSLPPRPKPWESSSANVASTAGPSMFDNAVASSQNAIASTSTAPAIPDRPSGLDASTSALGSVQPYQPRYGGAMGYGMNSYSGLGGYNAYSSPFNRYGGSYGYGGGYGMGGYGVGGMGAPGEVNCASDFLEKGSDRQGYPNLTSSLQQSTAPAFAVIESLVTAFTSLAQLVESTYMATHSSFFAMVGVADQLGSLKTYLGQVLGVFSILRLGRRIINWLKGKKVNTGGWANEWSSAAGSPPNGREARPSSKPLLLFLLSAVGLPWLMSRLVKLLIANQKPQAVELDPSKLEFARARWEFQGKEGWELSLGRDEIVAVLEKRDEGGPSGTAGWWRGRTRDGRIGWFPGNYVEVIRRREQPSPAAAESVR